jgi:hypothetical protein
MQLLDAALGELFTANASSDTVPVANAADIASSCEVTGPPQDAVVSSQGETGDDGPGSLVWSRGREGLGPSVLLPADVRSVPAQRLVQSALTTSRSGRKVVGS